MEARRARNAALFACLGLAACGAKARDARPLPPPADSVAPSSESSARVVPPPPPLASFDVLASRQVRLAPGMQEILRGETAAPLPKVERDTCVRIAFAAGAGAGSRVALVTKEGASLAVSAGEAEGALGERGPVCFHASDEPRVQVSGTGDAGVVRYVVWAAR